MLFLVLIGCYLGVTNLPHELENNNMSIIFHWPKMSEIHLLIVWNNSSLLGLNRRYRYMNHEENNMPTNSKKLGTRGSLSIVEIKLDEAQSAMIAANPKPTTPIRSSGLSKTFWTDLTILRDVEDSELSPVAFDTTVTRLCLLGVAQNGNLQMSFKENFASWMKMGIGRFAIIEAIPGTWAEVGSVLRQKIENWLPMSGEGFLWGELPKFLCGRGVRPERENALMLKQEATH